MTDKPCTTGTRNRRVQANQQPQRKRVPIVNRPGSCCMCGRWLPYTKLRWGARLCWGCYEDKVKRLLRGLYGTS